jgi:large-conductance mechanosensitive channel
MEKFKSFFEISSIVINKIINVLILALILYLSITLIIDRKAIKENRERLMNRTSVNIETDTNK